MTQVVHRPRVAWDAALALTRAARADDAAYAWCRDWVSSLLGPLVASALAAARRRLTDPTAPASEERVQMGLWRVRLDDALRSHPDLAGELVAQTAETRSRLASG